MFESKTQIAQGDFSCVDISGRAYLWTPKKGPKPDRLIITAHGIRTTTTMFKIKQESILKFYSNDKNSVQDPGLKKFFEGKAVPVETLRKGSNCYNYILTKYTNSARNASHNKNGETYNSIQTLMENDYVQQGMDGLAELIELGGAMPSGVRAAMRSNAMKNFKVKPACILTIRNRRFKADINLEWMLGELQKKGHTFSVIDCLFCRNTAWTAFVGSLPVGGKYSDAVAFG